MCCDCSGHLNRLIWGISLTEDWKGVETFWIQLHIYTATSGNLALKHIGSVWIQKHSSPQPPHLSLSLWWIYSKLPRNLNSIWIHHIIAACVCEQVELPEQPCVSVFSSPLFQSHAALSPSVWSAWPVLFGSASLSLETAEKSTVRKRKVSHSTCFQNVNFER